MYRSPGPELRAGSGSRGRVETGMLTAKLCRASLASERSEGAVTGSRPVVRCSCAPSATNLPTDATLYCSFFFFHAHKQPFCLHQKTPFWNLREEPILIRGHAAFKRRAAVLLVCCYDDGAGSDLARARAERDRAAKGIVTVQPVTPARQFIGAPFLRCSRRWTLLLEARIRARFATAK